MVHRHQMKMALNNNIIAYRFPTLAALFANAATISALAHGASSCFCWHHPQPPRCCQIRTSSISSLTVGSSKAKDRRIHSNKKSYYRTAWEGNLSLNNSIRSETRASDAFGSENDVSSQDYASSISYYLSSIREIRNQTFAF